MSDKKEVQKAIAAINILAGFDWATEYKWKPVIGLETSYEISETGIINSLKRRINRGDKPSYVIKEKFLSTPLDRYGYRKVTFSVNGKKIYTTVHRQVALAFIPNPDNLPEVNHKDGDKLNNHWKNLEWCSTRHNVLHYYKNNETSSKYSGVSKTEKSFRTQLYTNKVRYDFGTLKTEDEAAKIYQKALSILENEGLEKMIEYQQKIRNKFTSKYKGVSYDKSRNKWIASVFYKGKKELYKRFKTELEAIQEIVLKYEELDMPLHYTHKEYIANHLKQL
jgi:hypothetical protein